RLHHRVLLKTIHRIVRRTNFIAGLARPILTFGAIWRDTLNFRKHVQAVLHLEVQWAGGWARDLLDHRAGARRQADARQPRRTGRNRGILSSRAREMAAGK